MKKAEIEIGETYLIKVTGKVCKVKITGENRHGGWDGINTETKRCVRIKSAQRVRGALMMDAHEKSVKVNNHNTINSSDPDAQTNAGTDPTPAEASKAEKKASAVALALVVLGETEAAMNCKDMMDAIIKKGWKTGGKTPANTLASAIQREIKEKGTASRFVKAERGKFALA
jgi:hypothetical protein